MTICRTPRSLQLVSEFRKLLELHDSFGRRPLEVLLEERQIDVTLVVLDYVVYGVLARHGTLVKQVVSPYES